MNMCNIKEEKNFSIKLITGDNQIINLSKINKPDFETYIKQNKRTKKVKDNYRLNFELDAKNISDYLPLLSKSKIIMVDMKGDMKIMNEPKIVVIKNKNKIKFRITGENIEYVL